MKMKFFLDDSSDDTTKLVTSLNELQKVQNYCIQTRKYRKQCQRINDTCTCNQH